MASHLKKAVELTKTSPGVDRGGSRPKPPKAVAGSASLEAPRPTPDHEKAKRCLTAKTVAGPPAKGEALCNLSIGWFSEGAYSDFDRSLSAPSENQPK